MCSSKKNLSWQYIHTYQIGPCVMASKSGDYVNEWMNGSCMSYFVCCVVSCLLSLFQIFGEINFFPPFYINCHLRSNRAVTFVSIHLYVYVVWLCTFLCCSNCQRHDVKGQRPTKIELRDRERKARHEYSGHIIMIDIIIHNRSSQTT